MARQTLILAKNIREANEYAKVIGLQRFTYRAVRNAGAIRGVRNAEVHILSSFHKRLDRHAILNALRWAKLDVLYVEFVDGEIVGSPTPGIARRYPDDERTYEIAARYDRFRDGATGPFPIRWIAGLPDPDSPEAKEGLDKLLEAVLATDPEEPSAETAAPEPSEDPAPAEEPVRRARRRRCSTCGDLVEPDALADHEAGHAATPAPAPERQPAPADFVF